MALQGGLGLEGSLLSWAPFSLLGCGALRGVPMATGWRLRRIQACPERSGLQRSLAIHRGPASPGSWQKWGATLSPVGSALHWLKLDLGLVKKPLAMVFTLSSRWRKLLRSGPNLRRGRVRWATPWSWQVGRGPRSSSGSGGVKDGFRDCRGAGGGPSLWVPE